MPQLGEISVNDPIEVAIKLSSQWPARQAANAGEPRAQDLVDVVTNPEIGLSSDRRTGAAQQLAQAHGRLLATALGKGQRSHANADNPARTRMRLHPGRGRRARQEKATGIGAGVDGPAHKVPALGHELPLVNQDWGR